MNYDKTRKIEIKKSRSLAIEYKVGSFHSVSAMKSSLKDFNGTML